MKTDHLAISQSEPMNRAPAVSSLPRLSTNGTFIWLTEDLAVIRQRGDEISIELDVRMFTNHVERQVFADFIVTACNSHHANLARIAELEKALSLVKSDPSRKGLLIETMDAVNAALAKQ